MNLKTPHTPIETVATLPKLRHRHPIVKSLALEDIYADPHKLDPYLASGESVAVVRDGREVAELVPRKTAVASSGTAKWPPIDFRARFLKMWGPDAFHSPVSVAEEFAELRRERGVVSAFADTSFLFAFYFPRAVSEQAVAALRKPNGWRSGRSG